MKYVAKVWNVSHNLLKTCLYNNIFFILKRPYLYLNQIKITSLSFIQENGQLQIAVY